MIKQELNNINEQQLLEDAITLIEKGCTEYWCKPKRAKKDKRLTQVSLGRIPAAMAMRHIKKGGPFKLDPPRYKGRKSGPGLGLLEEGEDFNFETFKNMSVGDVATIKANSDLKSLNIRKGQKFTITKTSEEKKAFDISPPIINISRASNVEIQAFITSLRTKTDPFDISVEKKIEKKTKITRDTELSDEQKEKVAQGLVKKYIPKADSGFLEKIGTFFKDSAIIKTLGNVVDYFTKLMKKIGAALGIATTADESSIGTTVAPGSGQIAVFIGDSQMSPYMMGGAYKSFFKSHGYNTVMIPAGGKNVGYFLGNNEKAKKFEETLKLKPAYVVFHGGGNSSVAGATKSTQKIVDKIRQLAGSEAKIIWSGPPPFVKKKNGKVNPRAVPGGKRDKERKQMNINMKSIVEAAGGTFFDSYELMPSYYTESSDGYHVPPKVAKIYVAQIFGGMSATPQSVAKQYSKVQVANIIVEEARKAAFDPTYALTIARIESGLNPLSNINRKTQFKGLYQFGRSYRKTWEKYGLDWDKVHDAKHSAAAFIRKTKSDINVLRNAGVISNSTPSNIDPNEAHFLYLAWQQGLGGIKTIARAAQSGAEISRRIQGNMDNNTYPRTTNILPADFLEMWRGKVTRFYGGTQQRYAKALTSRPQISV